MLLPTAPLVLLKAGAQGISIARAIRLVDRTLQMYFSNKLLTIQPSNLPCFPPLRNFSLIVHVRIGIKLSVLGRKSRGF